MRNTNLVRAGIAGVVGAWLAACTADVKPVAEDFGFDGTCVNCHAGLSAGHVHGNYKLRCVDCHGGNDQAPIPEKLFEDTTQPLPKYRDPALIAMAHVAVKSPKLARFFFANGVDDNHDGRVDEIAVFDAGGTHVDFGEVFEPQLHGEGAGEFIDTELSRDLNYTRFLNPGDLRVATIGCGAKNRAGLDAGFGCHQQTIDIARRNIMVNQSAVINGAYYGNESWRTEFLTGRGATPDPRAGAFAYSLDYDGADKCITAPTAADATGRTQPVFDSACLEARASSLDPAVAAGAPGNVGLPAFEIAQNAIAAAAGSVPGQTLAQTGANDTLLPWGGLPDDPAAERAKLAPVLNGEVLPGIPDPVDVILRTFRAYYPLNYPGSTNNFDFTFGTSILPDIGRFKTADPFGRGHSSGCSACHAPYAYDGARAPTQVVQDDGTVKAVVDPTTQHRELHADQDRGTIAGVDHLLGRAVTAQQQTDTGRAQQKTYSLNHAMTTRIDTDTCGLCHGFVTRINLAYQGMAEEEQRDQLARRKAIEFDTPGGKTHVQILDSWVREDKQIATGSTVVLPAGLAVIDAARQRDAMLAAKGLVAGAGGCAQATFTEDCNNNGELDHALTLTRVDERGNVIASVTIDEDANGNGKLDLIDRVPREKSIDGRQMRYVYGGRNGSTRQMDVHFERGMHCIDCHFLQDVHGDGHVYSTNWDTIEIECEDCHGAKSKTNFLTSGPNGGNDLRRARDHDLQPFFESKDGAVIQRSRVTPGVFWKVPQTVDAAGALAKEAHGDRHVADPGQGSTFAGEQGQSPLTVAKVECQTCHSSWVHNCMGCHVDLNLGDPQRKLVDASGNITKSAHENEVWLSNAANPGHVNFQLQGLLRSPFVLGTGSLSEKGRVAPFRSSMQVNLSITDGNGDTIRDNQTFTTFQILDGNSQRRNVATSAVAMNQTMPHTTRPTEARGCETCHALVDPQGRVRNEHLLAESFGLGTGAYPYLGDWGIAAGGGGLELYEYKQEKELAANLPGKSQRFPGMIVNPNARTLAGVEPIFDGLTPGAGGTAGLLATSVGVDVALVRNFNATPVLGGTQKPTLTDLAIVAVDAGGFGKLVISDITLRGHPTSVRPFVSLSPNTTFVLDLPAVPRALAHLAPDVSDPFVYVAVGAAGVSVVQLLDAPSASGSAATKFGPFALPAGKSASDVALAGDLLYVGTVEGTIEVMSLADPKAPVAVGSLTIGSPINDLAVSGFMLYVATASGVAAVSLADPEHPAAPAGGAISFAAIGGPALGLSVSAGHVYAAGPGGVFDIDMRTPALPAAPVNLGALLTPAQTINAVDVVVSKLPGQTWLLALDANGDLLGIKLDNRQSPRERCFPDPKAAACVLDMDFLDPTIMQRDPSFDPILGVFDSPAVDPSSVTFFRQLAGAGGLTSGKRLARPAIWEQLNTLTGRRLRDSFMPGSGTLSQGVMQKMRSVLLCESTAPSHTAGGLNQLGYFASGSSCQPIGESPRPPSVCTVLANGKATCKARPGSAFAFPLAPAGGSSLTSPAAVAPAAGPSSRTSPAGAPTPAAGPSSRTFPAGALAPVAGPSSRTSPAGALAPAAGPSSRTSPAGALAPAAGPSSRSSPAGALAPAAGPSSRTFPAGALAPVATPSSRTSSASALAPFAEDPEPSPWIPRGPQSHAISQREPARERREASGSLAPRPPARAP
jgi:hypothetical protein